MLFHNNNVWCRWACIRLIVQYFHLFNYVCTKYLTSLPTHVFRSPTISRKREGEPRESTKGKPKQGNLTTKSSEKQPKEDSTEITFIHYPKAFGLVKVELVARARESTWFCRSMQNLKVTIAFLTLLSVKLKGICLVVPIGRSLVHSVSKSF